MPGKKRSAKSGKGGKSGPSSGKSRASRSRSPSGKKGKRSKSAKSKSRGGSAAGPAKDPDMLDPPAMYNLYYIAHAAQHALDIRGFNWPQGGGKKGKKGKKKK